MNPANPNHIVEAEIDPVNLQCDFNVSFDGGSTWTGGHLTVRRGGEDPPYGPTACDWNFDAGGYAHFNTGIVFGSADNVYVTFSAHRGAFNRLDTSPPTEGGAGDEAMVARSTDGGRTFEPAVVAVPGSTDPQPVSIRPQIAVQRGAGVGGQDRLYVNAWQLHIRAVGRTSRMLVARSDDGGATWQAPVVASARDVRAGADAVGAGTPDEIARELSQPVVGPDGAVYAAYRNNDPARFGGTTCPPNPAANPVNAQTNCIVVARSADLGQTWTHRNTGVPLSGSAGQPRLAIDPTDGTLYVAYHRPVPGDPSDITLQRSADAGQTWSPPVRVNDDPAGAVQAFPQVSVGPGAWVNVTWFDRRHEYPGIGGTRMGDIYLATSTSGGDTAASFTPNRRVTDRSINRDVGIDAALGSYSFYGPVAAPSPNARVLTAWMDSREGNVDNGFQDIYLSRLDPLGEVGVSAMAAATAPGLSVRLSRLAYPGGTEGVGAAGGEPVTRVVVANENDAAAALVGAVLARANLGPVLLSPAGGLPAVVKAETARLRPAGAYVLGNGDALSAAVTRELHDVTRSGENVVRLEGPETIAAADRPAELARRVAQQLAPLPAQGEAIIANPGSFEAASAAGLAAARRLPILFVDGRTTLPNPTSSAISSLGISRVLIVGGTGAVNAGVEAQLVTRLGAANVRRLGGANQYATSEAVAAEALARGLPPNVVYVADGARPVDAAALGAAVGRLNGLMLLAPGASPGPTLTSLTALGIEPRVDRMVTAVGTGGTDPAAPLAAPPATPPATLVGGPAPILQVREGRAGRVLELNASRRAVRSGTAVRMRGRIGTTSAPAACRAGQAVELQRRTAGNSGFSTLSRATSDPNGGFAMTIRPQRSADYRALVRASDQCVEATSSTARVSVPPVVTVVQSSTRLTGRTVRFALRCPRGEACRGTVKLRTASAVGRGGLRRRVTLGTTAFRMPSNGRRVARITVSPRVRSTLRSRSRVILNAFITARGPDGRAGFSRDRLVLRVR